MTALAWVGVGLGAWFVVAVLGGLALGRVAKLGTLEPARNAPAGRWAA